MLRQYPFPTDPIEKVLESRKTPENPTEMKGHDLEITCGSFLNSILVTGSYDGSIQIRMGGEVIKFSRTHDYLNGRISAVFFSYMRHLIYVGGSDGSVVIVAEALEYNIPLEIENNLVANDNLEALDQIDNVDDEDIHQDFGEILRDEHVKRIRVNKIKVQGELKEKVEKIKDE